ncbi:peptidase domain-containing ABC transporter [Pseudomonas sp. ZM23]|uniref:ATP-binding cassette domain-containing protein n=1 Tax=Pseudomonas triclosanedens TaxID=2961893 RepID=A0ABY7A5D0_9PSED|nr:ATP-binding cassette domain-containing protein [Pseudomonas triclosanedens]MCP8467816.1 peptidase domain-containing ABC transporter [Pseudomonas triclosanedens]MCP8473783.1 peptidase domain-containing ABC transporter [Pseudomonas triclosanedens]MCP8479705.1 peptidase domain-containing ABC transporter [Pseudomonas triclosanedens]WAI51385.1 ATP-binding cassette domain-containing protein [Pseudomonas triclosanedens]
MNMTTTGDAGDKSSPASPNGNKRQGDWLLRRLSLVARQDGLLSRAQIEALLNQAPDDAMPAAAWRAWIVMVSDACKLQMSGWSDEPDVAMLPMLMLTPEGEMGVVLARGADGSWRIDGPDGLGYTHDWQPGAQFTKVEVSGVAPARRSAKAFFKETFFADRRWVFYAALVAVLGNILALATSLYSMQVYDRVIPTQGFSTLIVLSVGALIAIVLELLLKLARSAIVNEALSHIDINLSSGIFERLLNLRMDQFPSQVGSLSGQLRSYETIRAFNSAISLFACSDAPFALFFLAVIFWVGGPFVAAVPLVFLILAVVVGQLSRSRIERAAMAGTGAGNRKLGLLVEAVSGAEALKAGGGGWQVLTRWNDLSRESVRQDADIRHLSETSQYLSAALQQLSYICMVATGAYVATTGSITSGAVVACSILSGRVLTPVNMIPGLLVQWANAKAAHKSLEAIFALRCDNHEVERPLVPQRIEGRLSLQDVAFTYGPEGQGIAIPRLEIAPGERVAILGAIGAGKSTVLRLLGGFYCPQQGRVLLDGLDIQQISRDRLSEVLGYLPQHVSLFGGTLRDNLLLGLSSKDDEQVLRAAQATGLQALIAGHPKGLDLPIAEGGAGLSGGQKQLVALTRLMLSAPKVWLLDEPTACMDSQTEERCIVALEQAMADGATAVLVTHKHALLRLVERIVVLTPQGVVLDGARDVVLRQLQGGVVVSPGGNPSNRPQPGNPSAPRSAPSAQVMTTR